MWNTNKKKKKKQAAGIAAAVSLQLNKTTSEMMQHVSEIQKELAVQNVRFL